MPLVLACCYRHACGRFLRSRRPSGTSGRWPKNRCHRHIFASAAGFSGFLGTLLASVIFAIAGL